MFASEMFSDQRLYLLKDLSDSILSLHRRLSELLWPRVRPYEAKLGQCLVTNTDGFESFEAQLSKLLAFFLLLLYFLQSLNFAGVSWEDLHKFPTLYVYPFPELDISLAIPG